MRQSLRRRDLAEVVVGMAAAVIDGKPFPAITVIQ
jgi:hypothetical protein